MMARLVMALRLVLVALPLLSSAFKWPLEGSFEGKRTFTFTETYMYSSGDAPLGLTLSRSEMSIDLQVAVFTEDIVDPEKLGLAFVFFEVLDDPHLPLNKVKRLVQKMASKTDLCRGVPPSFEDSNGQTMSAVKFQYMNATTMSKQLPAHLGNSTFFTLRGRYRPRHTGLQSMAMAVCEGGDSIAEMNLKSVSLGGEATFQNPYGYLPAIDFGYLPFYAIRLGIFAVFFLGYIMLLWANRAKLIGIHFAITLVVGVATLDAALSLGAYVDMNREGNPFCCPLPVALAASMVCEQLRGTLSRALVLLLCMGWGTARPLLTMKELSSVSCLSLGYLAAALFLQIHTIAVSSNPNADSGEVSLWYQLPLNTMDVAFLVYIYLSLVDTMEHLQSTKQTFKLKLYEQLGWTMAFFVTLVVALAVVVLISDVGLLRWAWQMLWLPSMGWEILNLGILIAVCIIWAPNERAMLVASSQQISTFEEDEEEEEEGDEEGIWATSKHAQDDPAIEVSL